MTQTRLLCALALLLTVGCGPDDVADDAGGAPLRTISRAATPVAQGASFQINEDVPLTGQLQAADDDGHPLTFLIVNDGSLGSVTLDDPNTGAFTYTPQRDAFGSDSFDFQATDGELSSEVATITITITPVNDPPVIHTLDGPRSANEGDALVFTATFSDPEGQPLTTFWDFGDGQEVNGVNLAQVQHTFTNQGVFGVTLLALDPGNNIASRFVPVRVSNVAPTVNAGDDVEIDQGEAVSFSGQASDPGADTLTFCWDFGDGSPEVCGVDLGDVEHTFNVPGVFAVTLTVDDGTAQTSNVLTATVNGVGPDVDIEVSPNPIAEGRPTRLSIALDDLSQSEVALTIDYGDGQREVIGGLQPPYGVLERSHAYAQEGTYLLRIVARNQGGFEGLAQAQVQVNNVAPQVTLPGASGQEGTPITLRAAAVDVPADALRFTWNFGDGAPPVETAEPAVTHTYAQEGIYTLSLSVFDGTTTAAQVAQVSVLNVLPTVELAARDGIEGVPVIFSATASDPGADTLIYCWTFGDGTPERCGADLTSVEHTYANVGSYRLLLKVRDGAGEVTRDATVEIINARIIVDAGPDRSVNEGQALSFVGSARGQLGDTLTLCWDFGDGAPQQCGVGLVSVEHTFADQGAFVVRLSANDGEGGEATDALIVQVRNVAPVVEAGPEQSGVEGARLTFQGSASDPGRDDLIYCWNFGEGPEERCDGSPVPVEHVYRQDGAFLATLVVRDGDGGTGFDTVRVTIANAAPQAAIATAPFEITEGGQVAFEASAADPGDDELELCWDFGDGGAPRCGGLELLSALHTYRQDGEVVARLTVSDDDEDVTVEVTGSVLNAAPRFASRPPVFIYPNGAADGVLDGIDDVAPYVYEAAVIDLGLDDARSFTLEGPPGARVTEQGVVIWDQPIARPEPYAFTLEVFDERGASDEQRWQLHVGYLDGDGDGAPDLCELDSPPMDALEPLDGALDFDGDGATNAEECLQGTDPLVRDTPSPPTIARPRDGEVAGDPVELVVDNALLDGGRALRYTFELYADADLTRLIDTWEVDEQPRDTRVRIDAGALTENGRYGWRARAFDGERASAFTPLARFVYSEVAELPSIPEPLEPQRRLIDPAPIVFVVTTPLDPEGDAFEIEIEIFEQGGLEPLRSLRASPERGPITAIPLPADLDEDGAYLWRARALTPQEGPTGWSEALTFRVDRDNDAPGDPVALSPAFEASVGADGLVFIARGALDVDREEEGLRYDLRLSTSASFEAEAVVAEVEGLEAGPGGEVVWDLSREALALAEDVVHHWDVQVRDREGLGGRAISRFGFSDQEGAPGPVRLESPTEGARVRTTAPALVWGGGGDPEGARVTYTLEVAEESDFDRPILAQAGIGRQGASTTWLGAALPDDSALFWRVRAVDAAGQPGPWSAPGGFVVDQVDAAPAAPTPQSPREGVLLESGEAVALVWATVEDPEGAPVSYTVELFDASGAQIDGGDRANAPQGAAQERFELAAALAPGGYFWRVRASAGDQESPWSEPARFSVASALVGEPTPARTPRTSTPLPSGCAQASSPTGSPMGSLAWVMVLLAAGVLIRRRG